MPFQVSPGVNVSEIDLTTVVPNISTSTAAFAGHFRWGPVDKIVIVDSEDTLAANFQTPNSNTATDFFVASNFLAYSNQLFLTRVIGSTAKNASASGTAPLIKNEDDYEENYTPAGAQGIAVAKYPGQLGNSLKVSICPSATAWEETINSVGANTTYSITTNTKALTFAGGTANTVANALTAGDLLTVGPDRQQIKIASVSGNTVTLASTYNGNTVSDVAVSAHNVQRRWEFYPNFDQAPGTSTFATNAGGSDDEIHIVIADEDGDWTGTKGSVLEVFSNVSVASDAKTEDGATNYYKNVLNQVSAYVWWNDHASVKTGAGSVASTAFAGGTDVVNASLSGGTDGAEPVDGDYITAYNKFKSTEDIDVALILGGESSQTVALHLINNIAEVRKDCIVCISPERDDVVNNSSFAGAEAEDIIAFRDSLPSSSYVTMDSGYKYVYDKYNDTYRYIPLNGDTAGLMVRTDTNRDPWYSPAGFNRGNIKNVVKLAYNPNKAERDELYKKGINPVVSFPGQGTVLFGDKTLLARPSAFDRINVRRLFIVLEKAIAVAAQSSLFEFNDEFTRQQFRNLVEPFLRDVQGRRGITDFRVVCDDTNNTGEVIDRNEFIGDIYIKPARSINFIQLNFVAVRTGVDFNEIVGQF
jgi:phage tail sheath protein FI